MGNAIMAGNASRIEQTAIGCLLCWHFLRANSGNATFGQLESKGLNFGTLGADMP